VPRPYHSYWFDDRNNFHVVTTNSYTADSATSVSTIRTGIKNTRQNVFRFGIILRIVDSLQDRLCTETRLSH
jgi:hypothetical protein